MARTVSSLGGAASGPVRGGLLLWHPEATSSAHSSRAGNPAAKRDENIGVTPDAISCSGDSPDPVNSSRTRDGGLWQVGDGSETGEEEGRHGGLPVRINARAGSI